MPQQKALFLSGVNGTWSIGERAIPKPGPGELLVKIHSTALNPVDWGASKIPLPFITDFPAVVGFDAAGTIAALGEGVGGFQVGDKVFYEGDSVNDKATFQQYSIVPAEITAKLPANISFDEGASISLGLVTAALAIFAARPEGVQSYAPPWSGGNGKYTGESFVVFGGSSSVGQYGIQLARLAGFSPIITTASPHHASYLKSIGATHVVDRSSDVKKEITDFLRETGAPTPHAIFDAISQEDTIAAAIDILAAGGQLATVHPAVDADKYKDSGKHIFGVFGSVHIPSTRAEGVKLFSKLTEWFGDGSMQPNRVEVLPGGLEGIVDGLERFGNKQVSGVKLVVRPQE